jgi:Ser/Thr protein kinase RdoA (MazF antagonist)
LARELYGLEATARALPGEYDENFHLTSADGHAFVLKVMHPARERSFIDLQCRALTHLAQRAPQLPLPRVTANRNREPFTSITAADGSARLVWLLTFVSGTVLAEVRPHTPELLGDLGRFLGEMDAALQSITHAAAHRELKWDSSRAGWIRDYIKDIADSKRRALVEKFLALYETEVVPVLPRLRRSVIYGDANDYNVLVSDPWERRPTGGGNCHRRGLSRGVPTR